MIDEEDIEAAKALLDILEKQEDEAATKQIGAIGRTVGGQVQRALGMLEKRKGDEATKQIGCIGWSIPFAGSAALKILEGRDGSVATEQINDIGCLVIGMAEPAMEALYRRGGDKAMHFIANIATSIDGMERTGLKILHRCESSKATHWIGLIGRQSQEGMACLAISMLVEREARATAAIKVLRDDPDKQSELEKKKTEAILIKRDLYNIFISRGGVARLELLPALSLRENFMTISGSMKDLCEKAVDDESTPESLRRLKGDASQWLKFRSALVLAQNIVPGLRISEAVRAEILGRTPQPAWAVRTP